MPGGAASRPGSPGVGIVTEMSARRRRGPSRRPRAQIAVRSASCGEATMPESSERLSETAAPLTFSILLETANLSVGAVPNLRECLQTLDEQEVSARRANEVLLVESGQIPRA